MAEISVHVSGGHEKIDSFDEKDIVYFSFSRLVEILGEKVTWNIIGLSPEYIADDHAIKFYLDSPYLKIDDTVKNITYPARMVKGNLYLPAMTFIPMFDLVRPEQITWDDKNKAIRINTEWHNVIDLAFSAKANGLLIEIFLTEPNEYEIYISEGDWLNVSVLNGRVNRRQIISRYDKRYLRDMNVEQFEKSAQISMRMRKPIGRYTDRFQPNPGRIQISLLDTTVTPASVGPLELGPDERIDKIVIDAGHGGKDYGAIGINGTKEKEIVLDIAKRLAKLVRKEKIFEVVMTREKDEYVSLNDRTKIANQSNGDLFISIHANASTKRSARGFQVFFLAPALNDEARALAQLENAPFMSELDAFNVHQGDDLTYIISDMIQTEFQSESNDFAGMVDKEFRHDLMKNTRARGIDQAAFYVLNGVYMPSILVETAFLTNETDESLLKNKKYRQNVAEAIYAGLKRFKAKYEKNQ